MKCENCKNEHDGKFGSGRFCSMTCARGYSTKEKRLEINKQVSQSLMGRPSRNGNNGNGFKKGYDPKRRPFGNEDRKKAQLSCKAKWENYVQTTPFESLSRPVKKRLVLKEQNGKCICGINEWYGKRLSLQLDHIDGDKRNEIRSNLRMLCPNCHSLTDTFCSKNSNKRTATDEQLIEALKTHKNIHQALKSLGMENGKNYARCHKLVVETGVEPVRL